MSTPFAAFGPGIVIGTRTDLATPAAINVGYAQELNIDFSASMKDLFGQNQFPLVSARGTVKATGKIKSAVVSGIAWNNLFFGGTMTPAQGFAWVIGEAGSIPTTPFQVTVAGSASFEGDLGVTYALTGLPLQRVASAPTTGQYSVVVATGIYTFAAADTGLGVLITYTKTITTATSQKLIVTNQPLGTTPTFQLDYYTNLNQPGTMPFAIRLFSCVGNKLAFATKLEDFAVPEIDFGFYGNASGQVFEAVFPQIS
jgi:hypothetical protein